MRKKLIIALIAAASLLSLASCGKDVEKKTAIIGDGVESQAADSGEKNTEVPSEKTDNTESAAVTLAPAATPKPDSAQKAQEKVNANNGNTNAVVKDSDGEREVDIKFTLENKTGIDFPALLLAPVSDDISKSPNILPEGQTFPDGQSITLDPGENAQLTTTLFNIAAIAPDGKGYVFQNIDLSSCSVIQLSIENGVPKAVIN